MTPQLSGESLIKRLNQSSAQGSTVTLTIDDELYNAMRGHEGKRYMLAMVEIGEDEQPTQSAPREPAKVADSAYDKSAAWMALGQKTKWLIDRCKDVNFQKYAGIDTKLPAKDRERQARQFVMHCCELVASRAEIEAGNKAFLFAKLRSNYQSFCDMHGVRLLDH